MEKQTIDSQSRGQNTNKESIKVDQVGKIGKIDTIIVSVDYNDFLVLTLENNLKYLDNITIVTSSKDSLCKKICDSFGVKCVITDRMYENGAAFNKGKVINEGIKSIQNPEWILLLDADISLPSNWSDLIKSDIFIKDSLYACNRIIIESYEDYQRWLNGEKVGRLQQDDPKGVGFFQLFNINNSSIFGKNPIYPEISDDASLSDDLFRRKFNKIKDLPIFVAHLGKPYMNWKGRKTDKFIDDKMIDKIIKNKKND